MEQTGRRKLAAILMADAVGYSLLMGQDEEGTDSIPKAYHAIFCDRVTPIAATRRRHIHVGWIVGSVEANFNVCVVGIEVDVLTRGQSPALTGGRP